MKEQCRAEATGPFVNGILCVRDVGHSGPHSWDRAAKQASLVEQFATTAANELFGGQDPFSVQIPLGGPVDQGLYHTARAELPTESVDVGRSFPIRVGKWVFEEICSAICPSCRHGLPMTDPGMVHFMTGEPDVQVPCRAKGLRDSKLFEVVL
jgi:hypothetical protein